MSQADRFQRISDLFERVRAIPPDERDAFLRDTCAGEETMIIEVKRLLGHHEDDWQAFDDSPIGRALPEAQALAAQQDAALPKKIGSYHIRQKLGEGGMGVVYLAEQENPRRRVAIKIIRPGFASGEVLKRFELETAVLGHLQHPGIAQIYEAGMHEDRVGQRPFFAMEFVDGPPLDEYVRQRNPSLRQRLALFTQICDAVQYAHQKGVIHRDLKPSNVVVTESTISGIGDRSAQRSFRGSSSLLKVLDFGVARATESELPAASLHTGAGQLVGTLPYMSPEQVTGSAGEVDTRSDVYSLGVVLYEVLSGKLPYELKDRGIVTAAKIIAEQAPVPLSTISRVYRGDLNTIVLKTLAKDPQQRYQSASELAADVERYLHDQPIVARGPSTWYQLNKFARRNTGLVAALAATMVVLVAGVVVSTIFAIGQTRALAEAERQTKEAEAEAKYSTAVNDFLSKMISSVRPEEQGSDVTMHEALNAAAQSVDRAPPDNLKVEAQIRIELGRAYEALADFDRAEEQLEAARDRARQAFGDDHGTVARALHWLGTVQFRKGEYDRAEDHYRQAVAIWQHLGEVNSSAVSLCDLSSLCHQTGRLAEAEQLAREALAIQEASDVPVAAVSNTLIALSGTLKSQARMDEAEEFAVKAVELTRQEYGDRSIEVAACLNSLALIYGDVGRAEEAIDLLRESIEIRIGLMGDDHPSVAAGYYNLGMELRSIPEYADAEAAYRAALGILEPQLGREHPTTLYVLQALGSIRIDTDRLDEAESLFREVLEARLRLLGEEHPETAVSLQSVASVHSRRGEHDLAVPFYRRVLEARRQSLGSEHPRTLMTKYWLAITLQELGQHEEALKILETVLKTRRRILSPDDPRIAKTQGVIGSVLTSLGRWEEAEAMLVDVYQGHADDPQTSDILAPTIELLATLYEAWGNEDQAARYRSELEALDPDSE